MYIIPLFYYLCTHTRLHVMIRKNEILYLAHICRHYVIRVLNIGLFEFHFSFIRPFLLNHYMYCLQIKSYIPPNSSQRMLLFTCFISFVYRFLLMMLKAITNDGDNNCIYNRSNFNISSFLIGLHNSISCQM